MINNEQYLAQQKVLYVEDEDVTREGIRSFLKRRVGKVITAADGCEGLEKFREESPDIVIADLLMPEMNGMDMLVQMRKIDANCKFIITSTVGEAKTLMEAIDVGVVKYVLKPVELPLLEKTLLKVAEELRQGDNSADIGNSQSDPGEKRRLEAEIKKDITLYIKNRAGKGPRDVSVFIHKNFVDVVAYDTLTVFEQKLMEKKANHSIIEQGRRSFYTIGKHELESMLSELMGQKVEMEKTEIVPGHSDKLVFRF